MTLLIVVYLGGVLTILSPCILPVLPFVFAQAERPAPNRAVPMLAGMAASFAIVGSLAAVGGYWAAQANTIGRYLALALLGLSGLALLLPNLANVLAAPFVKAGLSLAKYAGEHTIISRSGGSVLYGVATGLVWAPCAGPILGLILSGAALHGVSFETTLLLLAYAAGAVTSLAGALYLGRLGLARLNASTAVLEWLRRGLGVTVLVAVAAIAFGVDTQVLTRLSSANTNSLEQALIDAAAATDDGVANAAVPTLNSALLASLGANGQWLNSPPLTRDALRGHIVLVTFWTYSCINCIRTVPYVNAWTTKYRDRGLVVIGVHTPEFAFEKRLDNVGKAIANLGVDYPVAIDSDFRIWRDFGNQYWPAFYLIDAEGRVRHRHFGEGDYAGTENAIKALLAEAGRSTDDDATVAPHTVGAEAAPDLANLHSPESYIGYGKAANLASPQRMAKDLSHEYSFGTLGANQWALAGRWTVGAERAVLDQAGGGIVYRFRARDLHLVLGAAPSGKPIAFKVTIDGEPPGDSHGTDIDAAGQGTITETRLYQLVRQAGPVRERRFEIRFTEPGVEAFVFTFG
ncbi:MAG: cytochrome c biogenesis protein DipZ [Pseudolabrys sp.]|nr:cytochrome c biogenesis protein DipZ [Pseudolabrys sp.]